MTALSTAMTDYLALRGSLGFQMKETKRQLPQFLSFLDERGCQSITAQVAVQWAVQPNTEKKRYWAQRLSIVRGFARYLHGIDPRTEIPPHGLLSYGSGRRKPHIYTDAEVRHLLNATIAGDLPRRIRAKTFTTLFGLLSVTGMRLGECLNLDDADVDLGKGLLAIRGSKWRKSRIVPIHATTQNMLRAYRCHRTDLYPRLKTSSFFILDNGNRPRVLAAEREFLRVARRIGLRGPPGTKGPYLHDLRHRFAVSTLLAWYRSGIDVERHMPTLSTYLGHSHVSYTYWYLSAEPELLQLAARRADDSKGPNNHEELQ
jgi:integrase